MIIFCSSYVFIFLEVPAEIILNPTSVPHDLSSGHVPALSSLPVVMVDASDTTPQSPLIQMPKCCAPTLQNPHASAVTLEGNAGCLMSHHKNYEEAV